MKLTSAEIAALAENIRAVRRRTGMSQKKFAATVGVTQQTVSDWEKGRGLGLIVVAWRLANVLAEALSKIEREGSPGSLDAKDNSKFELQQSHQPNKAPEPRRTTTSSGNHTS